VVDCTAQSQITCASLYWTLGLDLYSYKQRPVSGLWTILTGAESFSLANVVAASIFKGGLAPRVQQPRGGKSASGEAVTYVLNYASFRMATRSECDTVVHT
jgi:hypothetical protein